MLVETSAVLCEDTTENCVKLLISPFGKDCLDSWWPVVLNCAANSSHSLWCVGTWWSPHQTTINLLNWGRKAPCTDNVTVKEEICVTACIITSESKWMQTAASKTELRYKWSRFWGVWYFSLHSIKEISSKLCYMSAGTLVHMYLISNSTSRGQSGQTQWWRQWLLLAMWRNSMAGWSLQCLEWNVNRYYR